MQLIIGGAYQGKLTFALTLTSFSSSIADGATVSLDDCLHKPVINHFHLLIKRILENNIPISSELNNVLLSKFPEAKNNSEHANLNHSLNETYAFLFLEYLLNVNPNVILIGNEIGYGIVPMEASERSYREIFGRICCKVAQEATDVYRIICGLPNKIK